MTNAYTLEETVEDHTYYTHVGKTAGKAANRSTQYQKWEVFST
jgi:hypothetical protein